MSNKITILLVLFLGLFIIFSPITFALEKKKDLNSSLEGVEQILKEIRSTPGLVTPDSINNVTAIKTLYYQNIQIMGILEEIRDLLKQSLEKKEEKE